jgi:hypothetical protein
MTHYFLSSKSLPNSLAPPSGVARLLAARGGRWGCRPTFHIWQKLMTFFSRHVSGSTAAQGAIRYTFNFKKNKRYGDMVILKNSPLPKCLLLPRAARGGPPPPPPRYATGTTNVMVKPVYYLRHKFKTHTQSHTWTFWHIFLFRNNMTVGQQAPSKAEWGQGQSKFFSPLSEADPGFWFGIDTYCRLQNRREMGSFGTKTRDLSELEAWIKWPPTEDSERAWQSVA